MAIIFKDAPQIEFDYYDQLPKKAVKLRLKGESEDAYKVNIFALWLFGLYKNAIYNSYSEKPDLAVDIQKHKNKFEEKGILKNKLPYTSSVYHYAIDASLNAAKEWQESNGKMKCYIAYENIDGRRKKIGFVHFMETILNGKPVIYIAQAGVSQKGKSIGRRLMECVLAHYSEKTEFYILTRRFNTEAKTLYQERLLFQPIEKDEIQQLGYDDRYCGFKHSTTSDEILRIQDKFLPTTEFHQNRGASPKLKIS